MIEGSMEKTPLSGLLRFSPQFDAIDGANVEVPAIATGVVCVFRWSIRGARRFHGGCTASRPTTIFAA